MLLMRFNSAYCDGGTFDCLEVEISVFGCIPAVYHPSSHLVCRISLISLLCVFYGDARKLFFFFFLVHVRVHRKPMLFLGDFFDRCDLTAVQSPHLFFMMLDLEVRGGGDKFVGDFFGALFSHLTVVPYYKLTDVTLQKV
jgi:hypothetical protein